MTPMKHDFIPARQNPQAAAEALMDVLTEQVAQGLGFHMSWWLDHGGLGLDTPMSVEEEVCKDPFDVCGTTACLVGSIALADRRVAAMSGQHVFLDTGDPEVMGQPECYQNYAHKLFGGGHLNIYDLFFFEAWPSEATALYHEIMGGQPPFVKGKLMKPEQSVAGRALAAFVARAWFAYSFNVTVDVPDWAWQALKEWGVLGKVQAMDMSDFHSVRVQKKIADDMHEALERIGALLPASDDEVREPVRKVRDAEYANFVPQTMIGRPISGSIMEAAAQIAAERVEAEANVPRETIDEPADLVPA